MLYCPMCGTAFKTGDAVCRQCSATLPSAPPDIKAIEETITSRAHGFSLVWSAFTRGFAVATLQPAVLVLPLLFAALIAVLGQISYLQFLQRMGGGGGGGATFQFSSRGTGWLMAQFDPTLILSQALTAGGRLGLPVPTPIAGYLLLHQLSFAPGQLYNWLLVWACTLGGAFCNAFQWRLMAVATRREHVRLRHGIQKVRGVLDLVLILSVLPLLSLGLASAWKIQATMQPLLALVWVVPVLLIGTWGCARVMADTLGTNAAILWRRTILSAEGFIYLFLGIVLLSICQYTIGFWQYVLLPGSDGSDTGLILAAGVVAYMFCHWVLTCVTQGLFCLMELLSRRPDAAAFLDAFAQEQMGH